MKPPQIKLSGCLDLVFHLSGHFVVCTSETCAAAALLLFAFRFYSVRLYFSVCVRSYWCVPVVTQLYLKVILCRMSVATHFV